MNKIELNRLSQVNNNEQNFLTALNENLKRIQEAINDTLSRTGVKPNQMEEVLDMNGNRICNVGPAVELTDVVTKQDIQNIIDAANEAIARLDGLVEAGKTALMNYAQEYIYPTVTAALDGAQAAQRAAEAARDALLLNPDYQALTQNLPTIMTLVDNITVLENIRDNMTELLAVSDDLTNIDAVAADLTNLDAIAGNLEEILRSSTYAQQAAQSASQASTSASNAANSATAAAGSATAAAGSATTATNKANEASASATAASGSASNAADSATAAASSVTTAANKANTARIWAEGTDGEVVPLGGSHSAKVWAQYVEEIIAGTRIFGGSFDASTATATLTSAAKAKLGTDANTIVLTNDTTPITGYAANEAIEYVVTVDGTFAGMTLKVNDILWSSGLSWYKIDNSETVIADATESTKGIAELATAAEAEAGVNDTKIMTPLKTTTTIQSSFLRGTTAPTTTTVGFVGQNYLDTVTGKSYVCTAVIPHQTATNTHYTTEGYTYSYDSNTGIISQSSNYAGASVLLNPAIDITGKSFEFVAKAYPRNTGLYILGNAFSTTNPNTYDHALVSDTVKNKWGWLKLVGVANGTNSTLYWIQDNGYTRETLPTTGWTTLSTTAVFNGGNPIIGRGYSSYASILSMSGAQVDLINSFIVVDGVTYNFVDVETTYTYTWEELANASDIKVYTAGTGINISSDTVTATAMTGADGTNAGTLGAVPAPAATDNTKFLRGDGTWAVAGGGGSASYDSTTQEITLG